MKFNKGQEFAHALITIIQLVNDIFTDKKMELDASQKEQMNLNKLNELNEEFIDELKGNIENYGKNDSITEYLHSCFDDFLRWKGFGPEMTEPIIFRNNQNVALLLELIKEVKIYHIMIDKWLTLKMNPSNSFSREISFTSVLTEIYKMKYLPELELMSHMVEDPGVDVEIDAKRMTNPEAGNESTTLLYQWNASDIDLLELSTALLKIRAITRKDGKEMTPKEMQEAFEKLFDYKMKVSEGIQAVIGKKSATPFLERLIVAFGQEKVCEPLI